MFSLNWLWRRLAAMCLSMVSLAACATPPAVPANVGIQPLILERFFAHASAGEGVFTNSWTGSERHFHVETSSTFDESTLTITEDFTYADGATDRKIWRLQRTGQGTYTGVREDVVGKATGWSEGAVVRLVYEARLAGWTVKFADVLSIQSDGSLLNRATVGKWGLRLGRVELVLRRKGGSLEQGSQTEGSSGYNAHQYDPPQFPA